MNTNDTNLDENGEIIDLEKVFDFPVLISDLRDELMEEYYDWTGEREYLKVLEEVDRSISHLVWQCASTESAPNVSDGLQISQDDADLIRATFEVEAQRKG